MNDNTIEMVARAISNAFNKKIPSFPEQSHQDSDEWKDWLEEAKAAIEVIQNDLVKKNVSIE